MYVPGYMGKLTINNARFAFSRCNIKTSVDNLRTTNSEGLGGPPGLVLPSTNIGFHVSINGNGLVTARVTMASWDTTANPFLAPFLFGAGAFVAFQLYVAATVVGLGLSYLVPSFHVLECDHDLDATGLQPLTFSGEGNGTWFVPVA